MMPERPIQLTDEDRYLDLRDRLQICEDRLGAIQGMIKNLLTEVKLQSFMDNVEYAPVSERVSERVAAITEPNRWLLASEVTKTSLTLTEAVYYAGKTEGSKIRRASWHADLRYPVSHFEAPIAWDAAIAHDWEVVT